MTVDAQNPTIAVVIPTHNRARILGRAIESVLAQTRPPDEILIVDDGSTDETPEFVAGYGPALTLVRKDQGGVSSARNLGVERSRAEFIAFLDSDDFWDEGHLAAIEQAIRATDGAAGLYFSDLRLSPDRGGASIWDKSSFSIDGRHELKADGFDWLLLPRQPMMIPASVVRRDAYLRVGGSDERFVCRGDTHLFFKLGLAGPICAVAGVGGEATSDDRSSLTKAFAGSDRIYLDCTVWLYADVLESMGRRRPEQRRIVMRRLASAYWDLSRNALARAPWRAAVHLAHALRHDPSMLPTRLRNLARRRVRSLVAPSPSDASAE